MTTINPSSLMAMRNAILQQNSALQKAAGNPAGPIGAPGAVEAPKADFTEALRGALTEVNGLQAKAGAASANAAKRRPASRGTGRSGIGAERGW